MSGNSPAETSLWFGHLMSETGWRSRVRVTIVGGRISELSEGVEPDARDERHAIGLPGLANLHSHAFQRAMAGLTEWRAEVADSFWSWRDAMYRFLDRLGPDELQAIAALAYMEMLETGFTRVGEFHYVHNAPDGRSYDNPAEMAARVVAAARQTGIGMTLLPVFYAHADFGGQAPAAGQRRFITDLDGFARLHEACTKLTAFDDALTGIAPHSLRAVTAGEMAALSALGASGPIHIHVAEQVREVKSSLAFYGARPVDWLLDTCPVGDNWCLVHATHMTPAETGRLAASGAVAGLCPITEANLGDGLFPARDFLQAGGRFGIGSDSLVQISAAEELKLLEYGQRLAHRGRNLLASEAVKSTGSRLYRAAVSGGAQALGVRGHLEVGMPADIVTLFGDHPNFCGKRGDELLDAYIFAGSAGAIDGVWRYGRKCVDKGRHIDRARIVGDYRATMEKMLS